MSRVLVVDDEADIRTVVAMNLALAGMEVGEASNGDEAVTMLQQGGWDGCILDLAMPGADGFDVLSRLADEGSVADLSIIVLSAHGAPSMAMQALQLGAHDHMTKPFAPGSLAQMMRALMDMTAEERTQRRDKMLDRATNLDRLGVKTV